VVRITRQRVEKNVEGTNWRGKPKTEVKNLSETAEEFDARVQDELNSYANRGWNLVNVSHSLPITFKNLGSFSNTFSDYDTEFYVFIFQRET